MVDLLQKYSLVEVIAFFIAAGLAIKGFITFYDWAIDRLRKIFKKENQTQKDKEELDRRLRKYENVLDKMQEEQKQTCEVLDSLMKKIELLIESDKDDIKAFITKEHHAFCYQKRWIDDYSLDCIERRYQHYKDEGGNSFIKELMEELRSLEKQPPEE